MRTFLVLWSCLQLCLGVDGVLQVVAWSRMLMDYSSEEGLARGMAMTFDGQHPCKLCKAIAKSQKERDAPGQPKDSPLLDPAFKSFLSPAITAAPIPRSIDFLATGFAPVRESGSIHGERPPLRPPRADRA